MLLTDTERRDIAERAAGVEARTRVEVVVSIVGRCDPYPEIPWMAFALFSALAAVASVAVHAQVLPAVLALLGAGASAALATVLLPAFARLFLGAARRETEVRQYAATFFLSHGLARTRGRKAVLLLVGVFERAVAILPDAGLPLDEAELNAIIARMTPQLAAGRAAPALRAGLDGLEARLLAKGFAGGGSDEIAQEVFEEKGA